MTNYKNVICSYVSYRRNIKDMPFVKTLTDTEQAVGVVRSMSEIFGDDYELKALKNLPMQDCLKLLEKGEITQELLDNKDISAFGKCEENGSYILINEQEHIRLIVYSKNFDLEKCYNIANSMDDKVSDKLELAFNTTYGYLTSNPMLCGTGMQVGCLLFLPAIVHNKKLISLLADSQTKDFEFFNLDGKVHDGKSAFVSIRNKYTFGYKENEFAQKLQALVEQIMELEMREENKIFDFSASNLVDKIYRSYGIAKNAYRLNLAEAQDLLCDIYWGINLKVLKIKNSFDILNILCKIKENHLNVQGMNIKEIEKARAKVLSSILDKNTVKGEVDV